MTQRLPAFIKCLLLALALGTGYTAQAQYSYTSVALTPASFTADVVANGAAASPPANSTTADVDGGGYYFISQDYYTATTAHTSGIPNNGLIPNTLPGYAGLTYQLAPLSGNNSLRIPGGAAGSGTVTFATSAAAAEVYVLASSGGAISTVTFTVNFNDGTSTAFTGQSVPDWFTVSATQNVFGMSARANATTPVSSTAAANTAPFLDQVKLTIPAAKLTVPITSIDVNKTSTGGYLQVMAVSILPTCAGLPSNQTPFAATTNGGTTALTAACAGTAFYLSIPPQGAVTYQWQSSSNGTTWTNISGATSATYTATQSAATYYRVLEACPYDGSGGTSVASNPLLVPQNTFLNCYCAPTRSSTSTSYATVTSVSLPGDNGATLSNAPGLITSTSTGYVSNSYAVYPTSVTTTTLSPNTTYTLSVAVPASTRASVWIDYDQSGTFDSGEFTILRTSSGAVYASSATTLTASILTPATALTGPTRLRIRTDFYNNTTLNTGTNACTTTTYGQAMDYTVTLAPGTPCTGSPVATTATASAATACSGTGVTLDVTGIAPGTTGLSFQWQSSPAGAGTFTNLGTAQTTTGYAVASQTASTDYRVVVTCTASGQSTTSSVVSVTTSYLNCYCAPVSGGTNEYIKGVTFPGTPGFTNATNANSSSGYGDFTGNAALTTSLTQGATYVNGVSVTVRSNNTNSQGGMWIDYDHSGTFDASEYVLVGTSSAIATDVTFPVTLVVPATALLGQTRVRVRWRNGGFTAADACVSGLTTWYGETEDYFITITAPTTCSAPPATVTASADVTSACSNASFSLSTSSVPATLGGYTYQWQSRTGTAAFADIAGATTNPYTIASQTVATDYRLVVSCQYGGTPVTSNTVSVGQNSFDQCYCTASSTNVCSNYGVITSVVLGSINNPSGCTSATSYSSYAASTTPTTTTNLTPGTTVTLTLGVASATSTYNYNYGVWIDFNHNGTFDASEFVAGSTSPLSTTTATISLAIPAISGSVLLGPTRMRIRTNAGIASYGIFTASGANGPCGAVYNGETEDYLVTLAPCTATTATFSYGTSPTFCVTGTTNPTVTLGSGATAGTFSSAAGLTIDPATGAITLSSSTPGTYTVTNTVGATASGCSSTATTTVTITAAPTAGFSYPTALRCAGTAATVTPTLATGATAGTYSLPTATGLSINATTGVVTVGATATAGTYTVTNTVAAAGGCAAVSSTATFTITAPTTATFSYGSTAAFCVTGTTNPTVTLGTGATAGTFTVSPATGLALNAATGAITLASSTPGTYTVTNTVASNTSTCGSTATTTVTINAAPTASFAYPTTTICAGAATTLTPTVSTGSTAGTYTLPAATGLSVNATTGVVTVGATATAGTYTVTNTVTAGTCAAVSSTATFTLTAPTTATFSYIGSPFCVTGTANPTPTITGTPGGTFSAPAGLSINATTGAITLSSSTPGTYTVTYTVSGSCGSTSTQSVTLNAAPTATFSYATPGVGAACAGGTGTFAPNMGTGATPGSFTASPAGLSLNATTGVISLAASTAGTYTITNTVTGSCAAVTGTSTFTVNPVPATPTLSTSGSPATGITLTSSAATGNQFYLNGVLVPGATGPSYTVGSGTLNGSYTVVVTSAAGCASAASAAVNVTVTAAHAPLPGTTLTLYPNPTRDGRLTLALSGYHEPVTLTVLNALGQRVSETTLSGNALAQPQTLNLSALPTGMYILQARTASGGVEIRRIVRE